MSAILGAVFLGALLNGLGSALYQKYQTFRARGVRHGC